MNILVLTLGLLVATQEHSLVSYIGGERVIWEELTPPVALIDVLKSYEVADDPVATGALIARVLKLDTEKEFGAAITPILDENSELVSLRYSISHDAGTVEGQVAMSGNELLVTVKSDGEESFSFPLVAPPIGAAGPLADFPIIILRPGICRCPRTGGSCTTEQCEDSKTCTGSDGTTASCEFSAEVVW